MADMKFKLVGLISVLTLALAGCATSHKKAEGAAGSEQPAAAQAEASGGGEGAPAAAAAGGEAKTGDKTAAAAAPAPAKPAPAAPSKPSISGSDVNTIEQKMAHYPRILWHSRDNTYRFYVGTVVFAEYNPFKDTFMIMTDNADHKNLVCKYTPDGGWKVEGGSKGVTCSSLLDEMNGYLSQTS
jgi:hypothetical protein